MIRGISFKIPNTINQPLWELFQTFEVEHYFWHNIKSQGEVLADDMGNVFFDKNVYTGEEFRRKIAFPHYMIFVKLQAYLKDCAMDQIETYSDFLKSDCQLLLLVNDCIYAELYIKEEEIINQFYKELSVKFQEVQYITTENDARIKMRVL